MRRREFISLLGGGAIPLAVFSPLVARAQQNKRLPTIGFLGATSAAVESYRITVFVQGLRQLGWIEGRDFTMEVRWSEGRNEQAAEIAAEFIRLKVDIIVTYATPVVLKVKQATPVIPIVFAVAADPVGNGLVTSLARPGGNVTGLSNQSIDLVGKRIELLREVVPELRRLGVLANVGSANAVPEMREVQATAKSVGLEAIPLEIRKPEDITTAFEIIKGQAQALVVVLDPLTNNHRVRINTLAQGQRLPTMHSFRELVEAGGLMSYGANLPDLFRRAASFVDKILRGAKPADLPVEQPTKFDLVVNVSTAKALGLTLPPTLLTRADEVIE